MKRMLRIVLLIYFLSVFAERISDFDGIVSGTFDTSPNGYGWFLGHSRNIQTNYDPSTGPGFASIYRQLAPSTGTGTIGGMTGDWVAGFNSETKTIYSISQYQSGTPYSTGNPGGRYPHFCDFIKGYGFGIFNDWNQQSAGAYADMSQAMFTVCDARKGWNNAIWMNPKRIEAVDNGVTPYKAWLGLGDVAFNEADGYFYWTTSWKQTLESSGRYNFVVGRTKTPADLESWEWTDYREYNFDTSNSQGVTKLAGKWQISYAKDIYGNGTGKAIALAMFVDETYTMKDSLGISKDVASHPRLGYIYTNNWGAEWSEGNFRPNWITPNGSGNNLFAAEIYDLFDWYGSYSQNTKMDWPYFNWEISAVTTEYNDVHVLAKVYGASTGDSGTYLYNIGGNRIISGYYDLVGEITEFGVVWSSANYISSFAGTDNGEMEYVYTYNYSIGYAGNGVVYAAWPDRPLMNYSLSPHYEGKRYICDTYFSHSSNNGATWEHDIIYNFDNAGVKYEPKFGRNITNTDSLQDEGFSLSSHGNVENGVLSVYASCQYYDPVYPYSYPSSYEVNYQYLNVWKIQGDVTQGSFSSLTVSAPNGGEIITRGKNYEIKWTGSVIEDVKLELYKGGDFFSIISESTENDGTFLWHIPDSLDGTDYTIKISSVTNPIVFDMSNKDFTIIPGKIRIKYPDGGEVLARGSDFEIRWISNLSENVKIELFKESALNAEIVSSTECDGSYVWNLPDSLTGDGFKIKISSKVLPLIYYDFSDSSFSIPPDSPLNLSINEFEGEVTLNWDHCIGASIYRVYSSNDPFYGFELEGSTAINSWNCPSGTNKKKFFFVSAGTEPVKRSRTIEVKRGNGGIK
jgi:hypothetical protein